MKTSISTVKKNVWSNIFAKTKKFVKPFSPVHTEPRSNLLIKQKKSKISWHCPFKGVLKWNQIRRKGSEPRKGAGSVKWKTVLLQKSTCSTHVSLRDIVTKRSYRALQYLPPYLGTRILVAASSSLTWFIFKKASSKIKRFLMCI